MELDAASRDLVSRTWLGRARTEANAVPAFTALLADLETLGAPPALIQIARDAIVEEATHAKLCLALASQYAGRDLDAPLHDWSPVTLTGVPEVHHPLLRVLLTCSISETLSSSFLALLYQRATAPAVRATLRQLLADEVDHARLGWAVLALPSVTDEMRGIVGGALPSLVTAALHSWRGGGDRDLSAHGCITRDDVGAQTRRALEELVLPGFMALGVDVEPTRPRSANVRVT